MACPQQLGCGGAGRTFRRERTGKSTASSFYFHPLVMLVMLQMLCNLRRQMERGDQVATRARLPTAQHLGQIASQIASRLCRCVLVGLVAFVTLPYRPYLAFSNFFLNFLWTSCFCPWADQKHQKLKGRNKKYININLSLSVYNSICTLQSTLSIS